MIKPKAGKKFNFKCAYVYACNVTLAIL